MSLDGIAQSPIQTAQPSLTTSINGQLGKNDFLRLLVTQMGNQDPLNPQDPTEYVAQLSQMTSLEQLINIGEGLNLLAVTQTAGTSAQMVSFIGKGIEYSGDSLTMTASGESVPVDFKLEAPAEEVQVRIFDDSGTTKATIEMGAESGGQHSVVFDGIGIDGNPLPAGDYKVEIIAKDADGNSVGATVRNVAVVTGVTFRNGYPELQLDNGRTVGLAYVLSVMDGSEVPVAAGSDPAASAAPGPMSVQAQQSLLNDVLKKPSDPERAGDSYLDFLDLPERAEPQS